MTTAAEMPLFLWGFMKIEMMPVSRLVKYNNNAKVHTPEQVAEIAKSIETFGFRQPVVVDRNFVIVIGHGRVQAAKELGLRDIPVTVVDDLTDDEINALRLVDNKLNEGSTWDFSALADELSGIVDIDMTDFGFEPISENEIDDFTRPAQTTVEAARTPAERPQYEHEEEPTETPVGGAERLPAPYTERTPLQSTTDYRGRGDEDAHGRQVVGERSLTDADGGMVYRYRCPRCKHLFN